MLSLTTRIIIAISGLLIAIVYFIVGNWTLATLFFTIPIFQTIGYFLNGTVFMALRKLGKSDFEAAERILQKTKYPKYLAKTQKAYYYLAAGLIQARKNNFQLAVVYLEDALKVGLRTKHDRAIASLNLANIYFNLGDRTQSTHYMNEAKKNNPAPALQSQIEELERVLAR